VCQLLLKGDPMGEKESWVLGEKVFRFGEGKGKEVVWWIGEGEQIFIAISGGKPF